jgi:ABC-type nitrate/sulfonate/bicarbonate transport system permease component
MTAAIPLSLAADDVEVAVAATTPAADGTLDRSIWIRERLVAFGRGVGSALAGLVVIMIIWIGFIHVFNINPLVAKSPWAVARYIASGGASTEPESQVWSGLARTLRDAGVGYVAGLAAAVAVALTFVLLRSVERAFMPIAVTVRSVPLVAMTPLIALVFGRGLLGTTVISGIVVFFPALVTVVFGLRSTPKQAADLVRAYGGSGNVVVRKVMIPSSLPAVFAAARVAVPGALVGGLLAEWLATGKGLGYLMLSDTEQFNYDQLWASVVILTLVSVVIYYAVGMLESVVLARFAQTPARR